MNDLKEFWKTWSPYFLDVWQYLVLILGFLIAAIIFL